jgi:hypothetical protein
MESDYSSDSDSELDTSTFQQLLGRLHGELTESILYMYEVIKALKPDSYTKKRTLTKSAQGIFQRKTASLKELVDFWMPLWKEEGRIRGRYITLGAEALLLGFMEETEQDVYDVCKRMCRLFI